MSKFATCLNCMDGRVQLPVINWIKKEYEVEFVDMITEAGMDGILSDNTKDVSGELLKKIDISLNLHGSNLIFIVGHYDCGGNPVSDDIHIKQIKDSVDNLKKLNLKKETSIIGLWVNSNWEISKV